ncbi:MAG: L-histidine N(alpha)-methyltransferase [Acidobacteria bacterium]|nr:MAG: L-histidine N(alpha)-methyltransferase [Acidobacteriota bacterium]
MMRPPGHPISVSEFEADVRAGLSKPGQKELYSKYFYDDLGSALFEAITLLPEYGLTRADLRLLREHAHELPERAGYPSVVVELGSGSGDKAREIIPYLAAGHPITYCPIDLSGAALSRCQRDLDDIRNIKIVPIEDSYVEGLASASKFRKPGGAILALFLGSSIGNFEPPVAQAFLSTVRENLQPGDVFLLSADLVKPFDRMLAGYNDSLGLTSAFNLNLLARINRELGASFDLNKFQHEARYNESEQRIEMHLRSRTEQTISVNGNFTVELQEGETIWTESSYKFLPDQVRAIAEPAGFRCEIQWVDSEWPFAQSLLRVR